MTHGLVVVGGGLIVLAALIPSALLVQRATEYRAWLGLLTFFATMASVIVLAWGYSVAAK